MILERSWIEQHVPQRGSMCLLDQVLSWDRQHALCRSRGHRRSDHPLRAYERLGSACAIEYAAQAAAVHGALMATDNPSHPDAHAALPGAAAPARFGMLASARAVRLTVARLDDVVEDLLVRVTYLHGDHTSALYDFVVSEQPDGATSGSTTTALAQGRLSLWLDAVPSPNPVP